MIGLVNVQVRFDTDRCEYDVIVSMGGRIGRYLTSTRDGVKGAIIDALAMFDNLEYMGNNCG